MSRPFEENDLVLNLEDLQAAAEGADLLTRFSAALTRRLNERRNSVIEKETDEERAQRYMSALADATVGIEMILDVVFHLATHLDGCLLLGERRARETMARIGGH